MTTILTARCHPQYAGFMLVLTGFLVQWPTILTLAMYPLLIWMYGRLARAEERDTRARFGAKFDAWAGRVPAYLLSLRGLLARPS